MIIRWARKKHYFVVALVLISFLFTFAVPAFAGENINGKGNENSQKIEVPASSPNPDPPANGRQEDFVPPGQENKGSDGPPGHNGENPGKGHNGDSGNPPNLPEPGNQEPGDSVIPTPGTPATSPGNSDHNEGVGQDPEQSNKITAAMIRIDKLVVKTYDKDFEVVYPPKRVGGGDGNRWPAVPVGGYVDYLIKITNNSGKELSSVKVWDNLPPHTEYVEGSSTIDNNPVEPSIGPGDRLNWTVDLSEHPTVEIKLRLHILNKAPKVLTNEAKHEFGGAAVCQVAIMEEEGPPAEFNLSIDKSVDKAEASAGETLTYTINYANTGNQELTGVIVTDAIPEKTEYVGGSATNGGVLSDTTLTWNIGNLPVGGSGWVSFQVKIKEGATDNIRNVATIDSNETDPISDDASTKIKPSEVVITPKEEVAYRIFLLKVVSHDTAKPGDILVYALHWANTGKATLTNVVLTDVIPAGTTYIEDSAKTDHNARVSLEGGVLVWRFDKIDPNTSGIYTFNVRINNEARGVVKNIAVIDSDQTEPEQSIVQTVIVTVAPLTFGPPTPPVLVAAPPSLPVVVAARKVVGPLPVTGVNLLVYFLGALFLIATGIGLQWLKEDPKHVFSLPVTRLPSHSRHKVRK